MHSIMSVIGDNMKHRLIARKKNDEKSKYGEIDHFRQCRIHYRQGCR